VASFELLPKNELGEPDCIMAAKQNLFIYLDHSNQFNLQQLPLLKRPLVSGDNTRAPTDIPPNYE
jgi:hypothetical protein